MIFLPRQISECVNTLISNSVSSETLTPYNSAHVRGEEPTCPQVLQTPVAISFTPQVITPQVNPSKRSGLCQRENRGRRLLVGGEEQHGPLVGGRMFRGVGAARTVFVLPV